MAYVGDGRDDFNLAAIEREQGILVAGLAVEPHRLEQMASCGGLTLGPRFETVLVDEMDGSRGPASVGLKKSGEIRHSGETRNCSKRPVAPGSAKAEIDRVLAG